MSEEKKKKKGRRAYLDDFQQNVAGEYIYTGAHYSFEGDKGEWKKKILALWGYTAAMTVAILTVGCIPVVGMMNTFYVIIPFAGTLFGVASVFWAMCRVTYGGSVLREYIYKATVQQFKARCWTAVIFSGCALVGEILFIILHWGVEHSLWAGLFLLIHLTVLLCGLRWLKIANGMVWTKS